MAKFEKRLSAPSKSNKYYYSHSNIFYTSGYGMPNCTAYAWGRVYELTGKRYTALHGNAEDWWPAAKKAGMKTGSTPKLGAICCWRAGVVGNDNDGAGHVAVVEEIKPNGDIVTSNSAWKGTNFYTKTVTKASGYQYSSSRPFQGFIYCGIDFDDDVKVETDNKPSTPTNSTVSSTKKPVTYENLTEGDIITLNKKATYYDGKKIPSWVFKSTLYFRGVNDNGIIFSTLKTGDITGVVKPQYIENLKTTKTTFKKGDSVKLKAGAKTYTGGKLYDFVYKRTYKLKEVVGDRAVITYGGVTVAAMNVKDLIKV